MAKEAERHFAEQGLHNVEPGEVRGSVDIFETIGSCGQIRPSLFGDVS